MFIILFIQALTSMFFIYLPKTDFYVEHDEMTQLHNQLMGALR